MRPVDARGFSLIELAIVVLGDGDGVGHGRAGHERLPIQSRGADGGPRTSPDSCASRARGAISTGVTQTVMFRANTLGGDYHVLNGTTAGTASKLPRGVQYLWSVGTQDSFRLTKDGRSQESGTVIVQDSRGIRDSVSVQQSGMVLIR